MFTVIATVTNTVVLFLLHFYKLQPHHGATDSQPPSLGGIIQHAFDILAWRWRVFEHRSEKKKTVHKARASWHSLTRQSQQQKKRCIAAECTETLTPTEWRKHEEEDDTLPGAETAVKHKQKKRLHSTLGTTFHQPLWRRSEENHYTTLQVSLSW